MLNVLCLKFGTKYSADYVNKLYNMVQRHLTVPHRFVCFTEDSTGLNSNIEIRTLPVDPGIKGWWWKTYLFKADHFIAGEPNLYLDLDIVIVNNIDKLVTEKPGNFMGFEDPSRVFSKQPKLNSSVMRWQSGHLSDIWEIYTSNRLKAAGLQGDQDWIWRLHQDKIKFYPNPWIQSYKWQVRSHRELVRSGASQMFNTVRNPVINPDTSILVFHGTPNPDQVQDPIIVDNWQ